MIDHVATMLASIIDEVIQKMGGLPLGVLAGVDSRKRLYKKKFAWVPLPLTDSEKDWACWETVGEINDYHTGFQTRWLSQARVAQGKLMGEMESFEDYTATLKASSLGGQL